MAARVRRTKYTIKIEDSLSRANFTVRCDDGEVIQLKELYINVAHPSDDEVLFTIYGNETLPLGSASYTYNEMPYISVVNPKNEDPINEPYYNLNSIKMFDCFNGKGLGAILLYYSVEYMFQNFSNINQISLDDDSDFGTSKDPALRAKSIYQQYGFYRTDSVKKFTKNGTFIPNPNTTTGQEHFIPRENVHGLVGWETKRNTLFEKIESKLTNLTTDLKKRNKSPESRNASHGSRNASSSTRTRSKARRVGGSSTKSRKVKTNKVRNSKIKRR